ncbi:hypothetical protein [Helcobacillus massiliensis]|uniref:Uncharacterized protein n=1 Tax=Helcobacillus massiliensis TaxID=521392 RepID=A0A839QT33_9MICO|nr:hypothetical protein [Helcobacillus massiliensis]MBB3021999.1 hypothetical protein [Helcobacillus massiliensis]MDK7742268.1 hypothetical protein [Helcobacillus massiliensis]WOO93520.1 hypothetical protein R3I40_02695 [Helcobacillus massiliensis]
MTASDRSRTRASASRSPVDSEGQGLEGRPERLRVVGASLLVLEAVLLLGTAVFAVLNLRTEADGIPTVAFGLAVVLTVFAALLVLAAVSLLRRGRYGVSYGITWQLFQALIGASMFKAAMLAPAVVVTVLAVAVFIILLKPQCRPDRQGLDG